MPIRTRAQVAYAMLEIAEGRLAPTDWRGALRTSLKPGTWVERYARRWYIAQWTQSDDGRWIHGRLAFERAGEDRPTIWDDDRNDVKELPETLMQVVPYVIDLEAERNRCRVAFELHGQAVRPGAFQGNFQALLGKSNLAWRVRLEGVPQLPWEEWRAKRVHRLVAIWLTLERPNPHSPLEEIEELFQHGVDTAQVVARGKDVDLDGPDLLRESFNHAKAYGKISAEAVTVDGEKEHWKSQEEAGVQKDEAERDAGRHVSFSSLQRLLVRRARGSAQSRRTADEDKTT